MDNRTPRRRLTPEQAARRKEMARKREKARRRRNALRLAGLVVVLVVIAALVVLLVRTIAGGEDSVAESPSPSATLQPTEGQSGIPDGLAYLGDPDSMQTPQAVDETHVDKLGIQKQLMVDDKEVQEYDRPEKISFGAPTDYTQLKGVITFRGNNYRDSAVYGTAGSVSEKKLHIKWQAETGSLGDWTGNGWTGQPLIVEWPEATRKIMNLHEDKKNKDGLVEVIYAGMDGKIHFYDLEDGTPTRDDINVGQPFKGCGALDPRGIPMIFLGGGDNVNGQPSSAVIYSLVDGSKLYEFGRNDPFSTRTFTAWDSSPLVSETDTLIYPGENGILYTMKLNTAYDEAAGTLSIQPSEVVKMRYTNTRHREALEKADKPENAKYWIGMESSAVVWKNFLYIADNCGDLLCIDLNTMTVVWAADTLDDTNCSPVLDIEADGKGYIYISTSLNWTSDEAGQGRLAMWKINATTGEKVQTFEYDCQTVLQPKKVSGGVQATALLGRHSISDLLIFPVARKPKQSYGMLYALDRNTFEERWSVEFPTEKQNGGYTWSSPIAMYDDNGEAYIIIGNADGYIFLFDKDGKQLDKLDVGSIEASPAAYGNTLVVGTRQRETLAIELR